MIWYKKDPLTIRSMELSDAGELAKGFLEQGWHKDRAQFLRYFQMQENKVRTVLVAAADGRAVGYVTLCPRTESGPFAGKKIPELVDFNVLKKYQNRGFGGRILDAAESLAAQMSDSVSLGVGLHSGYGAAQRLYVKRGYVFDGSGVWYHNAPLAQGAACLNDDSLILYMSKKLR